MATDTSLTGIAGGLAPNIAGIGSTMFTIITWGIIVIFLMATVSVIIFILLQRRRYKYTLIIFEDINGNLVDVMKDKGMEIKFGNLGTTVLYFKKLKRYEPFPKTQSGNRKFYFEKKQNGMLVNTTIRRSSNLRDLEMGEMSQGMLYHHTAINRGMEKRYDQLSKFQQYAPIIVSVVFIVIVGVMFWFIADKLVTLAGTTNNGVETAGKVMDKADSILGHLDNVCVGGKGFITNLTG